MILLKEESSQHEQTHCQSGDTLHVLGESQQMDNTNEGCSQHLFLRLF